MTRVRLYLVGSVALVVLTGCGRSFLSFEQRDPWRHEAEVACLKSGAVKDGPGLVRIEPIEGPGICGADFPMKVAVLGMANALGFADELRPPAAVPGGRSVAQAPRWPITRYQSAPLAPVTRVPSAADGDAAPPLSLYPPGVADPDAEREADVRGPEIETPSGMPVRPDRAPRSLQRQADELDRPPAHRSYPSRGTDPRPAPQSIVPLGPARGVPVTSAIGPVALKPAATLACPIVSALDQWIAAAVQPAALRWFGQPVVAIRQISAYSCRGMNGNPQARISEHAFGNALDIAAFVLADGHTITLKRGWHGTPEEQGFLHDVQGAACRQFTTVLAPGSNRFHYDHMHVDLMRRSSGRVICQPDAIPGEVAAARAARRGIYARRVDPAVTGSVKRSARRAATTSDDADWIEHDGPRERVD